MSIRAVVAGLLLGLSCVTWTASAQEAPATPSAAPPPSRKEVQARLRMLRAWEITRALKLQPEVAGQLLAIFARSDERRQAAFKEVRTANKALKKILRGKKKAIDEAALQAHVDAYVRGRGTLAQLAAQEFDELRKHLTPVQQAKYLLAERRFQQKIRQILKKVRKKGR